MKRELKEGVRDLRSDFFIRPVFESFRNDIRAAVPAVKGEIKNLKSELVQSLREINADDVPLASLLANAIETGIKPFKNAIVNLLPNINGWKNAQQGVGQSTELSAQQLTHLKNKLESLKIITKRLLYR